MLVRDWIDLAGRIFGSAAEEIMSIRAVADRYVPPPLWRRAGKRPEGRVTEGPSALSPCILHPPPPNSLACRSLRRSSPPLVPS